MKAIFIHGLGAGANSRTGKLLRNAFSEYEWFLPELTHYCEPSLDVIMQIVESVKLDLVIGTSLGGFYALCLADKITCPIVVLNPVVDAQKDILQFEGENHYFCKRLDKQKSFIVTKEDCAEFRPRTHIEQIVASQAHHIYPFYTTHDELLGFEYYHNYIALFGAKAIPSDLMSHSITPDFIEQELAPFVRTHLQ